MKGWEDLVSELDFELFIYIYWKWYREVEDFFMAEITCKAFKSAALPHWARSKVFKITWNC